MAALPLDSVDALVSAFQELSLASKVHSKAEAWQCSFLAEALKVFEVQQASVFVKNHQRLPLLYSYSFDTTNTLIAHKAKAAAGHTTVQRGGRQAVELLTQRILLRTAATQSSKDLHHHFLEAVPMSSGKSQWYVFSAACSALPLGRSLGHEGLLVYHVVADRLQLGSLSRLLQARQELYHQFQAQQSEASSTSMHSLSHLRDLFVSCGCALHDLQNAMPWSVQPLLVGEVLKDCHIVLESLRNSAPSLLSTLPNHLATRCVARAQPRMSETECRQLWSVLGVSASMLDLVVEVDPWYDGALLYVNPLVLEETAEDPFGKCSECVMYLLKWRTFSEARFLSMGLASAGLLTSLAVGLNAMVTDAHASPGVSTYHLNGFTRLKEQQQVLMIILTVVHQLLNEWFALVFSDDRLLRARQDMLQIEEDELQLIHSWSPQIWSALASLIRVPYDSAVLRSQALHAVHLAAGYVHEKIFKVMEQYPWRLGLSTGTGPLEELLLQPDEPVDLCTKKVWSMLKAGVPPAELVSVAELLQQASWSSLAVEQAHGSSATLRRYHPQLTLDHHLSRSFLHQVRHLFTPSHTQLQEEALQKKLERLQGRHREVSARNVFFKNLVAEARRQMGGGSLNQEALQQLMARHPLYYQSLNAQQRQVLQRQAMQETLKNRIDQQSEIEHHMANHKLQLARESQWLVHTGGISNVSSHYKFQADTCAALHKDICEFDQRPSHVQRLRQQACTSPLPPDSEVQSTFEDMAHHLPVKEKREPPLWVKLLCAHRQDFVGLIIGTDLDEGSLVYRFLYAVQNPRLIVFQKLQVLRPAAEQVKRRRAESWAAVADSCPPLRFQVCLGAYCSNTDLPFQEDEVILAVSNSYFTQGLEVVSFAKIISLQTMLLSYQHRHRHSEHSEGHLPKAPKQVLDADLEAHPWLQTFQKSHSALSSQGRSKSSTRSQPSSATGPPQVLSLDEEDIAKIWDELQTTREAWAANLQPSGDDFVVSLRGGAWTKQHRGIAADAVLATAAHEEARRFLGALGESKSASFSIIAYQDKATLLGQEWCARHQHFYNLWTSRGQSTTFTSDDANAYTASDEWLHFISSLTPADPAYNRSMELNAYAPRGSASSSSAPAGTGPAA